MTSVNLGDSQLEVWERGAGPNLVFIHGVATSGTTWAADLAALADEFRVLVYNRRGYGASSPSPRNWTAHADDAIALLEKLDAAPAILVGYSGGAIIAIDIALRRPELVSRLILVDPAFNLSRCLTFGLVKTLAKVKLLRLFGRHEAAAESWLRLVSRYPDGSNAYDVKASEERRRALLSNADGLFADLASGGGTIDEARVSGLRFPATIIDAALSPSFLRRSSVRLREMLPHARTVRIERSGHWIGLDAREELLTLLRNAAHRA